MIEGIWPVLCTPFRSDAAVDAAALRRVTRFAIDAGASGVVFPGFASEVDDLSAEERQLLVKAVVDEVAGQVQIIAGATASSVEAVTRHVHDSQALGINIFMIQAPKAVGADAAAVTDFYGAIARACPEAEIVLQNAPAPRGSDLSAKAVIEVAAAVPTIRYVKEETIPSGAAISEILAGKPAHCAGVLGGGGARFVIDEFLRGACGAMPAVELTDIHVAMWRALNSGRVEEARTLYERTLPLLMIQSHARMRFTKRVMTRRGVLENDVVRAKIPPFDKRDIDEIDALLSRVDDLFTIAPLRRAIG
jgi:4-hydroxy-tetrahydrodipicolinate synthase